jgi:hypothetical protein
MKRILYLSISLFAVVAILAAIVSVYRVQAANGSNSVVVPLVKLGTSNITVQDSNGTIIATRQDHGISTRLTRRTMARAELLPMIIAPALATSP